MKNAIRIFAAPISLILLSRPVWAVDVEPPAPVLEWSFYVLLIFAGCVAAFVFFKTSNKRKTAPLSKMLSEGRRPINSVHPDTTVTETVRKMHDENIGAMLVMEDDKLIGIFTERDALTNVLAAGIDPNTTKVSAVMTENPFCVDPSTSIEEAMGIVTHHKIRHLPIVHNGKLVGIVSSGDLTHWLVQDREGEIRELIDVAAHPRPR
jgi:signal-transduction protein with cAMP-binding, CBS, and nucleotidyltransferase domain